MTGMRRSIVAVLAGAGVVVVCSTAMDMLMQTSGLFPAFGAPMPDRLLVVAAVYRNICGVAGSYLTARIAPSRPLRHAMVLGVIGLVLSTAGAVATWNGGAEYGAKWYPLSLIATSLPGAWLGGWLREWELRRGDGADTGARMSATD